MVHYLVILLNLNQQPLLTLTEVFHSSYTFEFEPATSTHAHGDVSLTTFYATK